MRRRVVSSVSGHSPYFVVELSLLLTDFLMDGEQRYDDATERMIIAEQLDNLFTELRPMALGNRRPYSLIMPRTWFSISRRMATRRERATSMARILLTFFALDLRPRDTSQRVPILQASRIVFVALVHADRQHGVCMPRNHANNRQLDTPQFMPEPTRHRAGFKADALGVGRTFAKKLGQGAWMGLGLSPRRGADPTRRQRTSRSPFCETSSPTYCFMAPSDERDCVRTDRTERPARPAITSSCGVCPPIGLECCPWDEGKVTSRLIDVGRVTVGRR